MSRSRRAPHPRQPATIDLRRLPALCRRLLIGTVAIMLALGVHASSVAHAEEEYVFSLGVLVKVEQRMITLAFEDGSTETYRIGPATTIRSQNADERTLSDLEVGNPVLIITAEGDQMAVTVVDGGPTGFPDEAGPADIRGHEGACAGCSEPSAERSHT